jgi:hypothetical protein
MNVKEVTKLFCLAKVNEPTAKGTLRKPIVVVNRFVNIVHSENNVVARQRCLKR